MVTEVDEVDEVADQSHNYGRWDDKYSYFFCAQSWIWQTKAEISQIHSSYSPQCLVTEWVQ
jgi:hypothetical protein